ncbi:MAG: hypothetical protein HYZ16_05985 [Bacteroidetes bacterium]|jgi:hypothetical protein|nr:hypothetical protein [Bacteroidota bacterium]
MNLNRLLSLKLIVPVFALFLLIQGRCSHLKYLKPQKGELTLKDSIFYQKRDIQPSFLGYRTFDSVDFRFEYFSNENSLFIINLDTYDTTFIELPEGYFVKAGQVDFLDESTVVYQHTPEPGIAESVLRLSIIKSNGEVYQVLDTFDILNEMRYICYAFYYNLNPIRCFGNHVFVPVLVKKKGENGWRNPFVQQPDGKPKGPPCELHYLWDKQNKKLIYKGVIGSYPIHYVHKEHAVTGHFRNYFVDEKGDSLTVQSFGECDTVFIYALNGSLRGTAVVGRSQSGDFPKDTFNQDLNIQFERFILHKSYRNIWADAKGIYRRVTYPTPIEKDEIRKRTIREKRGAILAAWYDPKTNAYSEAIEYAWATKREETPEYYGYHGLYIQSRTYVLKDGTFSTYFNRYTLCLPQPGTEKKGH